MAATQYGPFLLHALKGEVDFDTATVKALLVGSGYTFSKDHEFRSSITSEVSGTGYTAGGITLSGVTVTYDATNDRVKVDANDAAFGTVTLTGVVAIITYIAVGSAATDILMSHHSFASQSPNGVPFTYAWYADGIGYYPA